MKKSTTKKKTTKKLNIITEAIKLVDGEVEDIEDQDDWYGVLESQLDAMISEPEWEHTRDKYNLVMKDECGFEWDEEEGENYEVALEQMVFEGVKKAMGRRHTCDPYYDDAFQGYDCMSKIK